MSSLFIADLHLQPSKPDQVLLAQRLFTTDALKYNNLFILGDFVEYWLGDDNPETGLDKIFITLKELSDSGTSVYIMHGNRDFLFSEDFASQYHINLILSDEFILQDEGHKILLMHGDTLCTDDTPYQNLRIMLRDTKWQEQFLAMPIEERIIAANMLRKASQEQTNGKSQEIMDVNQDAVNSCLVRNNLLTLIHGHTHRPAEHHFELNDNAGKRIVLGDWQPNFAYIASLTKTNLELLKWRPDQTQTL